MGRSPFFNVDKVEYPAEKPACAAILATLQPGQCVRLTPVMESPYSNRVHRTPSTYRRVTSPIDAQELIVDEIDIDSSLNKHGVRALALRDPSIPKEAHMYAWFVTTDGYVRECEHYDIIGILETIELL